MTDLEDAVTRSGFIFGSLQEKNSLIEGMNAASECDSKIETRATPLNNREGREGSDSRFCSLA